MAQRTCGIEGCERKHRARGYCSTHYNLHVADPATRHRMQLVACAVCGTEVARRATEDRYRPTCSVRCRNVVAFGYGEPQHGVYDWRIDAAKRAREAGARVIDLFDRDEIFERDGWCCQACGIGCTEPDPYVLTSATVDHVVPLSRGGEHSRANAQTLCLSCNSRKRDVDTPISHVA